MKDRKAGRESQVSGQVTHDGNKMHLEWQDLQFGSVIAKGKNVLVRVKVDTNDEISVGSLVLVRNQERKWREAKIRLEKDGEFKIQYIYNEGHTPTEWIPSDTERIWNTTPNMLRHTEVKERVSLLV